MAEVTIDFIANTADAISTLGDLGNIFTGLKSAVDLVADAFNAVKDAVMPFIDAASESQQAVSKLETVLASTGGTIGLSSQQIQDMATNLESMTGYSDEAEISAATMLLRFENLNKDIFPTALQLTNDLARSMGIDLTTAAQTIGKALDDPEQGIGRLNMQFKLFSDTEMENIKTMAAHGDVAGAQALIIERLTEKVGGAADAYRNTFAGALDTAKEKLGDLQEIIGKPILDAITPILNNIVAFASDPSVIATIANLGDAIAKALQGDFTGLDNFVGRLFENIATQIDIWLGGNGPQQLSDQIISFIDGMGTGPETSSRALNALKRIADALLTAVAQIDWGGIADAIDAKLAEKISAYDWTSAGDNFGQAIADALSGGIQGGMDSQKSQAVPAIAQALSDWFLAAAGVANWAQFKDTFVGIIQQFVLDPIVNWVKNNWYKIFLPMIPTQDQLSAGYAAWKNFANSMIDGLIDGLNSIEVNMTAWVRLHIVDPVKAFLGISSPSTLFTQIGKDIVQGLINGWDSMFAAFENLVKGALQGLLDSTINPILSTLGLSTINLGGSSSTGTTGGGSSQFPTPPPGGSTPSTGGTTVNQYFAGAIINVGSWDQIAYDCIYPNPFVGASSGQTGTTGGKTGTPH